VTGYVTLRPHRAESGHSKEACEKHVQRGKSLLPAQFVGVHMFSILLALALTIGPEPQTQQPDLTAANAWVSLVDSKRSDDSWAAAGTLFKTQMPQARWASIIDPVRTPLGAVSARALMSVTKSNSLPGVPDGEYEGGPISD
jgi:Protein of unknown function (DUF4019)